MYMSRASRSLNKVVRTTQSRAMSGSIRLNTDGAAGSGSSRAGGEAGGDAFTKREAASENLYVKQQEQAKIKALKEKIAKQSKDLKDLEDHVDSLTKNSK